MNLRLVEFTPSAGAPPVEGHDPAYATPNKIYLELPDPIRQQYTFKQWLWLGDREKATLVMRSCEPEHTE